MLSAAGTVVVAAAGAAVAVAGENEVLHPLLYFLTEVLTTRNTAAPATERLSIHWQT